MRPISETEGNLLDAKTSLQVRAMRVRPNRHSSERSRPGAKRRVHVVPRSEPSNELKAERRLRESGGPDDRAYYYCACGYVFEAHVSTSVACPNCGAGQAW